MQIFKIKNASGACRRFRLPINDALFSSLTQKVKTLYDFQQDEEIIFFYFDEEGDRVELGSEGELEEAISLFEGVLVLGVEKGEEKKEKEVKEGGKEEEEIGEEEEEGEKEEGEKEEEKEREGEKTTETKREEENEGYGCRWRKGCGREGWGKRKMEMREGGEEGKEAWRKRRIEMLKCELERLEKRLLFVEERKKEEKGGDMNMIWIVEETVLYAKKECVKRRIHALSEEVNNNNNNNNNSLEWKKLKTTGLRFFLDMISASLTALNKHLTNKQKNSDIAKLWINTLELKKSKIENQLTKMESEEEPPKEKPHHPNHHPHHHSHHPHHHSRHPPHHHHHHPHRRPHHARHHPRHHQASSFDWERFLGGVIQALEK